MSSGGGQSIEKRIKSRALEVGFDAVGITAASEPPGFPKFLDWISAEHCGSMEYMRRHAPARAHPQHILPGVKSIIVVLLNYARRAEADDRDAPATHPFDCAKVANYALGRDYHKVIRKRLFELADWIQSARPGALTRVFVDTAPILEREYARLSGLGWFGKNTMLINKRLGSWTFLGGVATSIELTPDPVHESSHCGTCTRCLDVCPTDAFVAPFELDSRRCISYLTIEHRGSIPMELRPGIGEWLFGCDECQDVCPWNRKSPISIHPDLAARSQLQDPSPIELLKMSDARLREWYAGSALGRAGVQGIRRNAAIVLGNQADADARAVLKTWAASEDSVVAEAAGWALDQINSRNSVANIKIADKVKKP